MSDSLLAIYKGRKKGAPDFQSFPDFENDMMDPEKRQALYDDLREKNPGMPGFEDFSRDMGFGGDERVVKRDKPAVQQGVPPMRMADGEPENRRGFWDSQVGDVLKRVGVENNAFSNMVLKDNGSAITKENVNALLPEVEKQLNEAYKAHNKKEEEVREKIPFLSALADASRWRRGTLLKPEMTDARVRDLSASKKYLDNARDMIEAVEKGKDGSFLGDLFRGLKDKVSDIDAWSLGVEDALRKGGLDEAVAKYKAGKELTKEEVQLMDAAAIHMATKQYYGSELGRGYKLGATTGEALPFLFSMLQNPVSGMGKGVANGVSKTLAKYGIEKWGTSKIGAYGKRALEMAGRVVGDVAESGIKTATTGAGRVVADGIARHTGEVDYVMSDGKVKFAGTSGGEDWNEAMLKAYGKEVTNNFMDMAGDYFLYGLGALNRTNPVKGFKKSLVEKMIDGVDTKDWRNAIKAYEGYAKVSNVLEGVGKEAVSGYVGGGLGDVANMLMTGDRTWEDIANSSNQVDALLGAILMGGFTYKIKSGNGYKEKEMLRNDLEQCSRTAEDALGAEHWSSLRADINEMRKTDQISTLVGDVLKNGDYTRNQKLAIMHYVDKAMFCSGYEKAAEKMRIEAGGEKFPAKFQPDGEESSAAGGPALREAVLQDGENGVPKSPEGVQKAVDPVGGGVAVPQTKEERPDYNRMLETEPEQFAREWEKRSGPERTTARLKRLSEGFGKRIEVLQQQADSDTDLNRVADMEDEIAGLVKQKERLDGVVSSRNTPPVPEVTVKEPVVEYVPEDYGRLTDGGVRDVVRRMRENAEVLSVAGQKGVEPDGDGMVDTCVGKVKMGEEQLSKMFLKKENSELGMIAPTLASPDVIMRKGGGNGSPERNGSYVFTKTFVRDGEKVTYYVPVTVGKEGMEAGISNYIVNNKALEKRLRRGKMVYVREALKFNDGK